LMKILGELPGTQEGEDNIEGLIKALDVDGDGIIDMDEWIAQLDKIPLLKAQLDQYIDPATGLILCGNQSFRRFVTSTSTPTV